MMGLANMALGPNTSRPHTQRKLRSPVKRSGVNRPNQVWSAGTTTIHLVTGLCIDGRDCRCPRKLLSWRLSDTLDSAFCVDCLEQALHAYGTIEIFNIDQDCQFTSESIEKLSSLR
ncbi:hypothetical protein [Candidatus Nitrotoga sp. M5]|uniref:hypothetical protein n=1 Tax=Candidatus Nitrotoga sp. M5 TaxID=2890409 RepID=UPI001EF23305|nr:hypothetical protein [Candidatus Nitrotoga sp. M5]